MRPSEAGRLLGFDEASLAQELRAAFEGTRFARVRRGRDDVEIVVKLPEELRGDRGELERLLVADPRFPLPGPTEGRPVRCRSAWSLTSRRASGRRSSRGTRTSARCALLADVNKREGNAADITAAIQAEYGGPGALPPGYSIEFKGEQQDADESFAGLQVALFMAVFMMYMILGSLFRSVLQPVVIMSAIPFGAVGMILGHLAMGRAISFMSLIGFVALTGIVVNDSLILQDFVNRKRRGGMGLVDSLVSAGQQRFRPILLTSVTTMLGLSPLTFFASGQARFLQPMAITIFFGLLCSTLLILLLVPCAYAVLEDLLALARRPRSTALRLARGLPVHDLASLPSSRS